MTSQIPGFLGRSLFEESMSPGSALAHLYRGEIHRMSRWRERLDRTTNCAVTVMAAILTWAFSDPEKPHFRILGGVAVSFFRHRGPPVPGLHRLPDPGSAAPGARLGPGPRPRDRALHRDWRQELPGDSRHPTLKIPYEEALAHRLHCIYLLAVVITSRPRTRKDHPELRSEEIGKWQGE